MYQIDLVGRTHVVFDDGNNEEFTNVFVYYSCLANEDGKLVCYPQSGEATGEVIPCQVLGLGDAGTYGEQYFHIRHFVETLPEIGEWLQAVKSGVYAFSLLAMDITEVK